MLNRLILKTYLKNSKWIVLNWVGVWSKELSETIDI